MTRGSEIQIEGGNFTRVHNAIFEQLAQMDLTSYEFRCLMFLFRMTYGYQTRERLISLKEWCAATQIERRNLTRTLNGLLTKRIIFKVGGEAGRGHTAAWGFNKYIEQWQTKRVSEDTPFNDEKVSEDTPKEKVYVETHFVEEKVYVETHEKVYVDTPPLKERKEKETTKERKRAAAPRAPTLNPACVIYREIMRLNPSAHQAEIIAKTVTDLELWRRCVGGWNEAGHKPTNVAGMLDWYRAGGPPTYDRPTRAELQQFNGTGPPRKVSNVRHNLNALEELRRRISHE